MARTKELTPKARVLTSFWAVVPGFIGTPILMSTWAPLWATVSWWVVHVSIEDSTLSNIGLGVGGFFFLALLVGLFLPAVSTTVR